MKESFPSDRAVEHMKDQTSSSGPRAVGHTEA